jgi:hypothetical protein
MQTPNYQGGGPAYMVLRALFDLPLIIVIFRGSTNLMDWIVNSGSNLVGVGPDGEVGQRQRQRQRRDKERQRKRETDRVCERVCEWEILQGER